jgi:hypothetical protein
MDGLDGKARKSIEKIVIHLWVYWYSLPQNIDITHAVDIDSSRRRLLQVIAEGIGYETAVRVDLYQIHGIPTIYGLMYGTDVFYYGLCRATRPISQNGVNEEYSQYIEVGNPMYKLDSETCENYLEYRNMLMYGKAKDADTWTMKGAPPYDNYPTKYKV